MSTQRVTSREWSPFDPWSQAARANTYSDETGGPSLERVTKVCRDARGHDRLRGCGKRYEGWVIQAGQRTSLPPLLRRQVTEDGAIWGLCDACIDRIEANRPSNLPARVARPSMRDLQTPQEIDR